MALKKDKELKLFYSIKEVAQAVGVTESTLRFWEKEFPQIAPQKGENGIRRYTKEDIARIRQIYHWVKEKGMTIKGVRQKLKEKKRKWEKEINVVEQLKAVREELASIRDELNNL